MNSLVTDSFKGAAWWGWVDEGVFKVRKVLDHTQQNVKKIYIYEKSNYLIHLFSAVYFEDQKNIDECIDSFPPL